MVVHEPSYDDDSTDRVLELEEEEEEEEAQKKRPDGVRDFSEFKEHFLVLRMKAWYPGKYEAWRRLYHLALIPSIDNKHPILESMQAEVWSYNEARQQVRDAASTTFQKNLAPYLNLDVFETLCKLQTSADLMPEFVVLKSPKCGICTDEVVDAHIVRHCSSCAGGTCKCPMRWCRLCLLKMLAESEAARFATCPTCRAEYCPKDVVSLGWKFTDVEVLHIPDDDDDDDDDDYDSTPPPSIKRQKTVCE